MNIDYYYNTDSIFFFVLYNSNSPGIAGDFFQMVLSASYIATPILSQFAQKIHRFIQERNKRLYEWVIESLSQPICSKTLIHSKTKGSDCL